MAKATTTSTPKTSARSVALAGAGLVVAALAALTVVLLVRLPPPSPVAAVASAAPATRAHSAPAGSVPAAAAAEPALAAPRLAADSEAVRVRMEERLPGRLYAAAAACDAGKSDRDEKIRLSYRLQIADGTATVSQVRADKSTITDAALERCIRDKVAAVTWRDDDMPDWDSTEELLIRVRGLKKHAPADEAD